jgi:hypothetical protein
LTSNNITYAAFGEAMKYWDFYPTGDTAWGTIPVWGFAKVVESRAEGVAVGERCYGYWPMGRYVVVQPVRVGKHGFSDGAAHRAERAAVYNRIERCAADPGYSAALEPQQALLKPLFITSFLIDDFLTDAQCFGAQQVLLSSASSKTAYGTAFCLALRRGDWVTLEAWQQGAPSAWDLQPRPCRQGLVARWRVAGLAALAVRVRGLAAGLLALARSAEAMGDATGSPVVTTS